MTADNGEWRMRDLGLSYEEALHGVQSAVAFELEKIDAKGGTPKHLRTGVNSAMADISALAKLLIDKGVFTLEEYVEAVRLAMNEELARHEETIGARYPDAEIKFR